MDALAELKKLKAEWMACPKCDLATIRKKNEKVVFGGGPAPADFLFIYDAPSEAEVRSGQPLLGDLGDVLLDLIRSANLPDGSWSVTQLVGCRPYVVLPATEGSSAQVRDREPSSDEIEACYERVAKIIYYVDPRLIFAVGELAWKALVRPKDRGQERTISVAAGKLYEMSIEGMSQSIRYPVMALLPPKQILANPSSAAHGPITVSIEAIHRAKTYVTQIKKMESST